MPSMGKQKAGPTDEPLSVDMNHPVFSLDPEPLIDCLDKVVKVTCRKGSALSGILYSIDPITQNLVLVSGLDPSCVSPSQSEAVAPLHPEASGESKVISQPATSPLGDCHSGRELSQATIHLVCRTFIQDVTVMGPASDRHLGLVSQLFDPPEEELSASALEKRKADVKALLRAHRLPVEETAEASLRLGDHFTIASPYTARTCSSTNELILAKVQGLLNKMAVG